MCLVYYTVGATAATIVADTYITVGVFAFCHTGVTGTSRVVVCTNNAMKPSALSGEDYHGHTE